MFYAGTIYTTVQKLGLSKIYIFFKYPMLTRAAWDQIYNISTV